MCVVQRHKAHLFEVLFALNDQVGQDNCEECEEYDEGDDRENLDSYNGLHMVFNEF